MWVREEVVYGTQSRVRLEDQKVAHPRCSREGLGHALRRKAGISQFDASVATDSVLEEDIYGEGIPPIRATGTCTSIPYEAHELQGGY